MSRGLRQSKAIPGHVPRCGAAMPSCPSCGIRLTPPDMGLAICPVCGADLGLSGRCRFLSE